MKVLLGADLSDTSRMAEELLFRLLTGKPDVEVAHVVEPILPDGGSPHAGPTSVIVEILDRLKIQGEAKAAETKARIEGRAGSVTTSILHGFAARALAERAVQVSADLVAVGSERKGALGSLFMGSVTKGLALESRVSVLIGKSAVAHDGPLKVVVATDGSEYFGRCLDRFLSWSPTGLGEVTIMSAYSGQGDEPRMRARSIVGEAATKWHEAIGPCLKETREGPAGRALGEVMAERGADLLVIGAQGSGFFERVFVGSVAMHQVINEPWNLLLLRA